MNSHPVGWRLVLCMLMMGLLWGGFNHSAHALIPTTMNFQGRLMDSAGNIKADGLYNMKFAIYTVASGGTAAWSETREVSGTDYRIQLTNGLFSTQLGQRTPLPASLFANTDLYFEITMATPATATCNTTSCQTWEAAMPTRQKLAASAYAFQAENANYATTAGTATTASNADTLDGLHAASFGQLDMANTWTGTNLTNVVSSNAFTIQNATTGSALLNVDTQGGYVINNGTSMPGNLLENPGFESAGAAYRSTGWTFNGATNNTATGNSRTGTRQGTIPANGTTHDIVEYKLHEVNVGDTLYLEAWVKYAAGTNGSARIGLNFYDAAGAYLSTTGTNVTASTTYTRNSTTITVPSGARFVKFSAASQASSTTGGWFFDDLYLAKVNQAQPLSIRPATDGSNIFDIQNAAGTSVLNVSTTGGVATLNVAGTGLISASSATALVVQDTQATPQALLTADTTSRRVTIGDVAGCTGAGGSGRLCINQSMTAGASGTNMANVMTVNTGSAGNYYTQRIVTTDTSSSIANYNRVLYLDATGTTNGSATIDSITAKVKGANAGNLLSLQGGSVGASDIFTVSNAGTVQVGSATTDATANLFILDSYNQAADPTGYAGAMYFNTNLNKYRCYNNSAWNDCAVSGGGANTSLSNLSGVNIGTTALNSTSNNLNLTTTTSGNIVLNSAGTIELQDATNVTVSSAAAAMNINQTGAGNLLKLQSAGSDVLTVANNGGMAINVNTATNSDFSLKSQGGAYMFNFDTLNGYTVDNGTTSPGNLLESPGFESDAAYGFSGWSLLASNTTIETTNPHSGNRNLKLTADSTQHIVGSTKYYAVVPGDTYYLEGWVKADAGTNGSAAINMSYYDKNKTYLSQTNISAVNSTTYTKVSSSGTVPANTFYLRISATNAATSTTGAWYFDDLYFAKVSQQQPLSIRPAADGSNIFEIQNAAGTSVLNVSTTGGVATATLNGQSLLSATSGIQNQYTAAQAAASFWVDGNGRVQGQTILGGTTNQTQLIVKANASQTAANPLIVLQNGAGTEAARINSIYGGTYFGLNSGQSVTASGANNTAMGAESLMNLTSGANNAAFGYDALRGNQIGGENTAIGMYTLFSGTNVNGNTALGYAALQNATGDYNSALGRSAGYMDNGGLFVTRTDNYRSTAIGAYAQVQASDSLVLGSVDLSTKVGIGITKPGDLFSVSPVRSGMTGTVAQSGTTTVTGSGTNWQTNGAQVGDTFIFANGLGGTITSISSDTQLTVSITNTVAAGTAYRIHRGGFNVSQGGDTYIKQTSTAALTVQNAGGGAVLAVDTANSAVQVGSSTTDTIATKLVLDSYNQTTDPTGVNGAMYYNSTMGTFRCYENNVWKDCLSHHVIELAADVTNSNATANTLADITGLSFPTASGKKYRFHANILYYAAASTTGSRWTIGGTFGYMSLGYTARWGVTQTTETYYYASTGSSGTPSTDSPTGTGGNIAILEGAFVANSNGTFTPQFSSEVGGSAIIAKAGSTLEWW